MSGAGAKVEYGTTLFNRTADVPAGAVASTSYVETFDVKVYRPSGEDRSLLADVKYNLRMFDDTNTERWNDEVHGLVVTTGLNQLITAGLLAAPWYAFLVDGTGFLTISASDTMASHAGWAEESADYSSATRPVITFGTPAVNGSIDNSASQAQFTFTGSGMIVGAGVCSLNTKGVDSGTLYDVGLFTDGNRPYNAGWNLYLAVTCSVSAA